MTRNEVTPETAEQNRRGGGYTFNAFPPDSYEGTILTFAVLRIGDHAHVEVESGHWRSGGPSRPSHSTGGAGKLILRWREWEHLRAVLDAGSPYRIAEVESPTSAQIVRYTAERKPADW